MQQLDLFYSDANTYLYSEVEKLRNSTDRRCRAIFSLLTELQEQVITLQQKGENESNGDDL